MCQLTLRALVRDNTILQVLESQKNISGPPREYIRAFSWFPNSSIPRVLRPLLQKYLQVCNTLLRDPRDISGFMTVVPSAFWLISSFSFTKLALHALLVAPQAAPFVLMLHCVCHRPLFKDKRLDGIIHYVLSPFYGHTWNSFYYHHIKHHHVEGNGPRDLSSTLPYQRDSILHFMIYFTRFMLLGWIELPLYFLSVNKPKFAWNFFIGEISSLFCLFYTLFFSFNGAGFFCVLWIPFLLMRLGMMCGMFCILWLGFMKLGNWGQHAFVDASNPDNDYTSSITCINVEYNKLCFNDGYHTSHHLNPLRHWQDHPDQLATAQDKYKAQKSLVFDGIDFFQIWFYLMIKDYDTIARHVYQFSKPGDQGYMDHEQVVDLIKLRIKKMSFEEIKRAYINK